jgi:hypothetical protein
MTTIQQLIRRCLAGEPAAWLEMWEIVEGSALRSALRLLRSRGLDPSLIDDARQDLFVHFREHDATRLRAFRGASEAEFHSYAVMVGVRFAERFYRGWRRARRRDIAIRRCLGTTADRAVGPGPRALLDELEAIMSRSDRRRLRVLVDLGGLARRPPAGPVTRHPSARAVRRWRQELFLRYGGRVF